MTFAHIKISQNAQYFEGQPAIIVDGKSISYGMLDNAIINTARWLTGVNVTPKMVVALSLSDAVLQLYLTLALFRIGAIQATLDPRLPSSTFKDLIDKLGVQLLVKDAQPKQTWNIRTAPAPGRSILEANFSSQDIQSNLSMDSIAFLCHGSGTTGEPKVFALRHRQLLARCTNLANEFSLSPGDRSLILQRHTTLTYLTRAIQSLFYAGCLVEVSHMRNGTGNYFELLCNAVDEHRVDHLSCTAFHAKSIVDKLAQFSGMTRFPQLKTFLVGASSVSRALRELVIERVTPNLCINYGTNETGPISRASPTFLKSHFDSVGSVSPNTEIAILGTKWKRLKIGQEGIVAVRGHSVIDRYEGDEAASRTAFSNGWFRTGDVGRLSGDGALYVFGRSDDMLIIDGTNVYPAEIERVIDSIREVKESAVVGAYSDLGFDMIAAFVVMKQQCTEPYIIATCTQQLGWKSPHQVFFVNSLPRNFAGKILRKELVKRITIVQPKAN